MPQSRYNADYVTISRDHKKLVRRLVSPRATAADWEEFYATIRERVTNRFAEALQDEAWLSVDDFMRGELTAFLCENKCERLRQFLNLRSENSDHQHLFGRWFTNVIKSAKDTVIKRARQEVSGDEPLPAAKVKSSDNAKDGKETILDNVKATEKFESKRPKEYISLAKLLRSIGGNGFSKLMAKFWKKNPQETYIALMDAQLNYRYRKIAALLGRGENQVRSDKEAKKEEISIAGKQRNLRRKFYSQLTLPELEAMFPFLSDYMGKYDDKQIQKLFATFIEKQGDEKFYGADGESDVDLIEQMGAAFGTLCFGGGKRRVGDNVSYQWVLELKMPFEVSDKALIRGVLSDGNGGVPQGVLFCCGKKRKVRANGHFEFPVYEFKKFSNSSELHFTSANGKRTDGVPFVPEEFDGLRPTMGLLESWACRRMSDFDPVELTADLLDDFGYVLPQLLLKDDALDKLPFEKFGVPRIDRRNLRREYNEAFVLFRAELPVDPDSPLSPDGFMLPLEWRFNPYAANMPSNILPLHLSALARKVTGEMRRRVDKSPCQDEEPCKWQLQPSIRFFDDRVDFSAIGLLGGTETDVASATGALAVALNYAENEIRYRGWPFSSLAYDFAEGRPQGVGGIAQKMALTASFGGKELFVAPVQQGLPTGNAPMAIRKVSETLLVDIAGEIAFDHLAKLRPSTPVQFKTVPDELLARRTNLVTHAKNRDGSVRDGLFSLANKKEILETNGTFVVLLGGPGMGKSVLMGLLQERCTSANTAIGYVCQAGRANQGWEFVKSLAHGLASTYGEVTDDLLSVELPDSPPKGDVLKGCYANLVVKPLRKIIGRHKGEKMFVLVDGLDEDASGEVMELLLDEKLRLPPMVGVIVSSRHIVQDEDRLLARAKKSVIDLDRQDTEYATDVRMDVRTYIDQWTCMNEAVYNRLLESKIDSELLKDAIQEKDRSFLYAYHVLSGIAAGQYRVGSIEELQKDLPKDLKACFYGAFKTRFQNAEAYNRVKPLLRQLVRKGRISEADASRKAVVGEETLGAVLKALRGYAVVTDGEISLSSEALRMWLGDSTHNAEFGV